MNSNWMSYFYLDQGVHVSSSNFFQNPILNCSRKNIENKKDTDKGIIFISSKK